MYTEKEARELVIKAGLELVEKKLIARTWGNISARISDTEFVITPSGRAYDSLTVDDLVKINIRDLTYDGDIKPSSEKGIHAACYRIRSNCNFVIHTHQFFATAVAAAGEDTEFAPCAEYGLPGTDKLKNRTEKCIQENPNARMFLLARHGVLLLGNNYDDAFELADELEEKAEAQFCTRVPHHDIQKYDYIDYKQFATKNYPSVILLQDPYIMENCYMGVTLKPHVDDFAQIVGPDAPCCSQNPLDIRIALRLRSAVLVKGVGAICVGKDDDDAEAVGMNMSKNCAAACYVRSGKHMGRADATLQRFIYLRKYSKHKDA